MAFDQTFVIAAVINTVTKKSHSLMMGSWLKDFADFALTKGAKKSCQTAESIVFIKAASCFNFVLGSEDASLSF